MEQKTLVDFINGRIKHNMTKIQEINERMNKHGILCTCYKCSVLRDEKTSLTGSIFEAGTIIKYVQTGEFYQEEE